MPRSLFLGNLLAAKHQTCDPFTAHLIGSKSCDTHNFSSKISPVIQCSPVIQSIIQSSDLRRPSQSEQPVHGQWTKVANHILPNAPVNFRFVCSLPNNTPIPVVALWNFGFASVGPKSPITFLAWAPTELHVYGQLKFQICYRSHTQRFQVLAFC